MAELIFKFKVGGGGKMQGRGVVYGGISMRQPYIHRSYSVLVTLNLADSLPYYMYP